MLGFLYKITNYHDFVHILLVIMNNSVQQKLLHIFKKNDIILRVRFLMLTIFSRKTNDLLIEFGIVPRLKKIFNAKTKYFVAIAHACRDMTIYIFTLGKCIFSSMSSFRLL